MTRTFTNTLALVAAMLISLTMLAEATRVPASDAARPALAAILA